MHLTIEDGTVDISVEVTGNVLIWDGSSDIVFRSASDVDVVEDSTGDIIIH